MTSSLPLIKLQSLIYVSQLLHLSQLLNMIYYMYWIRQIWGGWDVHFFLAAHVNITADILQIVSRIKVWTIVHSWDTLLIGPLSLVILPCHFWHSKIPASWSPRVFDKTSRYPVVRDIRSCLLFHLIDFPYVLYTCSFDA